MSQEGHKMERERALEMAVTDIERQYGKGAVMKMGEVAERRVDVIPTGALSLDLALGIGGVPRGRVVELYGPESSGKTTVALHIVAEAQRNGGLAAFIDAEHALDPVYAKAIGVDVDELLISQPDTGEQALEIADMLIRSGALDVLVVDSVAALVPRAEIEGEMGDSHVGLQARLMSQALRKLAGTLNKSQTTAVFINQLREKIGVMFGCLSWGTPVQLADGSTEPIGKIVAGRMPVEVLSYDEERGEIAPRRVVGWFDNGPTEEFLRVKTADPVERGRGPSFECTPNHKVRTPAGWKEAQELGVGDRVLRNTVCVLSDQQREVLLGALMGAAELSPTGAGLAARLRWGRDGDQSRYGEWKASLFGNVAISRATDERGGAVWETPPLPELAELQSSLCVAQGKTLSWDYLKALTPLSLAIWHMDAAAVAPGRRGRAEDGSGRVEICVETLERTSRERLRAHLADTWGARSRLVERDGLSYLLFTGSGSTRLQTLIAPFVHPSMAHKLTPRHRGRFDFEPVVGAERRALTAAPIVKIERMAPRGERSHRFDIEVERSHNYFAGEVMVHNSPETTPGGRALKFYSSVRLDIRRIEAIKDGADNVGNRVRVKVVKNKMAPPFRLAEFDIMFGEGVSREGSLLDVAVDNGVVKKSGAWFTFDQDQLGQGREKAKRFLRENPEVAMHLQAKVFEAVGMPMAEESATGDK